MGGPLSRGDPRVIDRALETLNRRGPDGSGRWTSADRHARPSAIGGSRSSTLPSAARSRRSRRTAARLSFTTGRSTTSGESGQELEAAGRTLRVRQRRRGRPPAAADGGLRRALDRSRRHVRPRSLGARRGGGSFSRGTGWESSPSTTRDLAGRPRLRFGAQGPSRLSRDPGPARSRRAVGLPLPTGTSRSTARLFAGIRKLPPGHRLIYRRRARDRFDVDALLEARALARSGTTPRSCGSASTRRFDLHLVSDVPVGRVPLGWARLHRPSSRGRSRTLPALPDVHDRIPGRRPQRPRVRPGRVGGLRHARIGTRSCRHRRTCRRL